jgi:cytochrome c oxidase subunit 2
MMELFSRLLGLPVLAGANGKAVDELIIYVHWLMAVLFIGWFAYFIYTLWRFNAKRHPKADHHGVRSHASSYIEVGVVIAELVLLIGFAIPMWAKASNVTTIPDAKDATTIQIVGQQFFWNARYAGKDGVFGKQDMAKVTGDNTFGVTPDDPNGKDDVQVVNEIHVPVNKYVICHVSSKDVIHSFKIIALRVTQDAIPGMRIPFWFKATKEGRYQINCAQLCGGSHSAMAGGMLVVESQKEFDKWIASKKPGAAVSFE